MSYLTSVVRADKSLALRSGRIMYSLHPLLVLIDFLSTTMPSSSSMDRDDHDELIDA
jgi:hypothetical protein